MRERETKKLSTPGKIIYTVPFRTINTSRLCSSIFLRCTKSTLSKHENDPIKMFLFQLHERRLQISFWRVVARERKKPDTLLNFYPRMMSEEQSHLVLFAWQRSNVMCRQADKKSHFEAMQINWPAKYSIYNKSAKKVRATWQLATVSDHVKCHFFCTRRDLLPQQTHLLNSPFAMSIQCGADMFFYIVSNYHLVMERERATRNAVYANGTNHIKYANQWKIPVTREL